MQKTLAEFSPSKAAFKALGESKKDSQKKRIWEALRNKDMSAQEIIDYTGIPWKSATPRISELKNDNLIEVIRFKRDLVTGSLVSVYRANKLVNNINIKYGCLKKNNTAQKYAKNVARGEIKPSYTLTIKDTDEIISLIKKFIT